MKATEATGEVSYWRDITLKKANVKDRISVHTHAHCFTPPVTEPTTNHLTIERIINRMNHRVDTHGAVTHTLIARIHTSNISTREMKLI